MKSIVCLFTFLLIGSVAFAQSDSTKVSTVNPEYEFIYHELFNFMPNSTFGELKLEQAPFLQQKFNFQPEYTIDFNAFSGMKSISLSNQQFYFNPFINSGTITSQDNYQLNDRLVFGGNSFAGSTIFDNLPANPSIQDMSIRGASMFLQYQLSKKVKLSGSFSISSHEQPFIR